MNTLRIKLGSLLLMVVILIGCVPAVNAENATAGTNLTNLLPNSTAYPAEPFITIDPIGNHTIGEVFFINGTTNLPVSENLIIEIIDFYWLISPKTKGAPNHPPFSRYVNLSNISILSALPGANRFSANVTDNVKDLVSTDYWVAVYPQINESINTRGLLPNTEEPQIFTLFPENNSIKSNVLQTEVQNISTVQPTFRATTVSPTTQSASLPLVVPIAVLVAIVILKSILGEKT